jgi:hypothetical protein
MIREETKSLDYTLQLRSITPATGEVGMKFFQQASVGTPHCIGVTVGRKPKDTIRFKRLHSGMLHLQRRH